MFSVLPWIVVAIAILHVLEEYFFGWLTWAKEFVPTVKLSHFIVINALFIALCTVSAIIQNPFLMLSVYALILVNAFVHIGPTILKRKYSPGLVSALILYIPVAIYGYLVISTQIELNTNY